jgi:hypothetical protein
MKTMEIRATVDDYVCLKDLRHLYTSFLGLSESKMS